MIFVVAQSYQRYLEFMHGRFPSVNPRTTRAYIYVGPNDARKLEGVERGSRYIDLGGSSFAVRCLIAHRQLVLMTFTDNLT